MGMEMENLHSIESRFSLIFFSGSLKQHVIRHATKKHPDYKAEELVEKSTEVKMDLSDFEVNKTSTKDANEIVLQNDGVEDLDAVTHIIFQDPDNPGGDQIMTISTDQLEDQNVTIMTIDADSIGSVTGNENIDGQIMKLAAEDDNVMIITEEADLGNIGDHESFVVVDGQDIATEEYVEETVIYTEESDNVQDVVIDSGVDAGAVSVPWKN